MENRRGDKVIEIEDYLGKLESIVPENLDKYLDDFVIKAACERYFEKIVEAVIDLVFLIIKERKLRSPESDRDALGILSEKNIISSDLADKLSNAKSMRNIIIHEYGCIDNKLVFESIKNEILNDVKEFLEATNEI